MTARPQDVALPSPACPTAYVGAEASYVWAAAWAAGVQAALASAQAREDELRAEVERWRGHYDDMSRRAVEALDRREDAEARAERLAEALREARDYVASELSDERAKFAGYEHCSSIASIEADLARIDAALSTNAATQPGETNEAAE